MLFCMAQLKEQNKTKIVTFECQALPYEISGTVKRENCRQGLFSVVSGITMLWFVLGLSREKAVDRDCFLL